MDREQSRREFEERLSRAGLDMEDFAREEDKLRDLAGDEIPLIETSRSVEAQISRTLEMHAQVGQDALTGAFNLRRYKEEMRKLQEQAVFGMGRRKGDVPEAIVNEPFSLITLDIDHFKKVNDTYGHHAGDQVLQEVVRRIHNRLRKGDVLARCGGEEFRVVALAINGRASHLADNLRQLIEQTPFTVKDNAGKEHELRVTISLGVSPYNQDTHNMEMQSDTALYAAKGKDREGESRNQVWLWSKEEHKPVAYNAESRENQLAA